METSVGSTIEKIKQQEYDKEIKLKENREYESAVVSLQRAIREANSQKGKSEHEQKLLQNKCNALRTQLTLEKIRRDALLTQLHAMKMELEEIRRESNTGVLKVWEQRSSFCKEIQSASDKYDVWALLAKPVYIEPITQIVKEPVNAEVLVENENRLQNAIRRREKAIVERDRLKAEPECGEEFIRNSLRNKALYRQYCTEVKENEPIKFSTSEAARRKLPSVFRNKKADTMPWYQPYSVVGSVAVFLLYFCVIREENDIDLEFTKTLYERIKGLEKEQLLQTYKYNKEQGLSVIDIEKRLQEIDLEEAKLA